MIRKIFAISRAQSQELVRRKGTIAMLVLLPLVFYWASGSDDFAPTFATVGAGWAISIVTLFLTHGMAAIAPRLALLGFTSAERIIGRLVSAASFSGIVVLGLWIYIGQDEVIVRKGALALAFLWSLLGAISLGLAVGALIRREMEAMLVLVAVVGLQFVVDQSSTLAKVLPLYAAERYSGNASGWAEFVDGSWRASALVSFVLLLVAIIATVWRSPRPVKRPTS